MIGIETSYAHGEPCMYATSGSGRVMKSPSRGTMRSWPVRPGKYARANMSRNRCRAARAAASADATRRVRGPSLPEDRLTCWPEIGQAIATRVRARRTAPQTVSLEEMTKVRRVVTAPVSKRRSAIRCRLSVEPSTPAMGGLTGGGSAASPGAKRSERVRCTRGLGARGRPLPVRLENVGHHPFRDPRVLQVLRIGLGRQPFFANHPKEGANNEQCPRDRLPAETNSIARRPIQDTSSRVDRVPNEAVGSSRHQPTRRGIRRARENCDGRTSLVPKSSERLRPPELRSQPGKSSTVT